MLYVTSVLLFVTSVLYPRAARSACSTGDTCLCLSCALMAAFLGCRVPVEWHYNSMASELADVLTCTPASGTVPAHSKQSISVRVSPGVPAKLAAVARFDIAHFDPVRVPISVEGQSGALAASLPRQADETWASELDAAAATLQQQRQQELLASVQRPHNQAGSRHGSRPGARLHPCFSHRWLTCCWPIRSASACRTAAQASFVDECTLIGCLRVHQHVQRQPVRSDHMRWALRTHARTWQ